MSGCLKVLMIMIVLVAIAVGAALFFFTQTQDGRRIWSGATDTITVMLEARKAPGTKAIRALGCEMALVIKMDELIRALQTMHPDVKASVDSQITTYSQHPLVACGSNSIAQLPTCDAVAQAYIGEARPASSFSVMVRRDENVQIRDGRDESIVCAVRYNSLGKPLGEMPR